MINVFYYWWQIMLRNVVIIYEVNNDVHRKWWKVMYVNDNEMIMMMTVKIMWRNGMKEMKWY